MSARRGVSRPAAWACLLLILWGIGGGATPGHAQPNWSVPANVEVVTDDPLSAASAGCENVTCWRVRWDDVDWVSETTRPQFSDASYRVYMERVDTGGVGSLSRGKLPIFVNQSWKDIPVERVSDPTSYSWTRAQFVVGSAFGITVTSLSPESEPSEEIYFGSHPAPTVTARRSSGNDVQVNWVPRELDDPTASRGGSAVTWVITASAAGQTDIRKEVDDTGPNESNPGQTTLVLDRQHEWTVQVVAENAAGAGLAGETTVYNRAIELSLDTLQVLEGDGLDLTVTATVIANHSSGHLGNEAATLSVNVAPGGTAGNQDYAIADQLPVTIPITADATHGSTFTEIIRGVTTELHEEDPIPPPKTLRFAGTIAAAGQPIDIPIIGPDESFTIYSRIRAPTGFTRTRLTTPTEEKWRISWDDISTYDDRNLDIDSYKITLRRVDGGLDTDEPGLFTTTETFIEFPVVDRREGNAWNGRQFIREQGFHVTVHALHATLYPDLIGTEFDPTPSEVLEGNIGTHPPPQ